MQGRWTNLLLVRDKIMEVLPRLDRIDQGDPGPGRPAGSLSTNRNYGIANALVLAGHFRNLLYTLSILLGAVCSGFLPAWLRTQRSPETLWCPRSVCGPVSSRKTAAVRHGIPQCHDGITLTMPEAIFLTSIWPSAALPAGNGGSHRLQSAAYCLAGMMRRLLRVHVEKHPGNRQLVR